MTTRYKTRALVFKKSDINESDRIFSVFTEDFGRLDIFAKAIRKNVSKLRGGIGIFFLSEIEFIQGKSRKTLTDAVALERFDNISRDMGRFKIVNRIGEVLDNFIKGTEKDEEVFNLLNEALCKLNNSSLKTTKCEIAYHYFLWNTLSSLGYRLEVQKCASCYEKLNPYNVYFSSKEGGIICGKCLSKDKFAQKINSDIVKVLRIIFLKDWQTLSKLKIEPHSQKLLEDISQNAVSAFCPA